jgi:hypothetical protein
MFRGLFQGALVVQTLAAHFNAIEGSNWIEGLYEGETPPLPHAALALAAVAVISSYFSVCIMLISN